MLVFTKYALSVIFLTIASLASAQNNTIDSLRLQIAKTTNQGELLKLYLQLSKACDQAGETRSLRKSATQLQELSTALNDSDAQCYVRYYHQSAGI
jgi:hypothetical protein